VFNGGPFSVVEWYEFNPGSAKQRIERLWEAGWQPTERTDGHKDFLKSIRRRRLTPEEEAKKAHYQVYGWTTSEENLKTLPDTAPEAARKLVRWLLVARRSQILKTWLDACTAFSVSPEGTVWKIHGRFVHIGAWTHRMAHSEPNTGNIPRFDASQPEKTPYSDQMRGLWIASPDRYLVGVDAEGIQLRVLAHYINDPEFTEALIRGDKKLGTDAHSMNQKALGDVCKSRDDAKTFIYAWILDAGIGRVAEVLGCTRPEAEEAAEKFLKRYPGLKVLKEEIVPSDAERGFFIGLDGRPVRIWGDTLSERQHFALAGYLQNGESVIMKRAAQIWHPKLIREGVPHWPVNFVHDEWQTETRKIMEEALYVANTQADSIRQVGEDLKLNCPMAGSILNGHGKPAIGLTWLETH
jgi:DNA polymerase-1